MSGLPTKDPPLANNCVESFLQSNKFGRNKLILDHLMSCYHINAYKRTPAENIFCYENLDRTEAAVHSEANITDITRYHKF